MEAREDGRSVESVGKGRQREWVPTALLGVTISVAIVGWKLVAVVDGKIEKGTQGREMAAGDGGEGRGNEEGGGRGGT